MGLKNIYDPWRHRSHVGNTTSPSHARPGLYRSRRLSDKAEIQDIIRHNAIDVNVNKPLYRKTGCPAFVPFKSGHTNNQQHSKWHQKNKRQVELKVISLPMIYEHLYLSNLDYALQADSLLMAKGIDFMINVSNHPLKTRMYSEYIVFSDDANVSYKYFHDRIEKVVEAIKWSVENKRHVLIHCAAGTNRSVSAIIAYALQYCTEKKSVDEWIKYIENRKVEKGYMYWDTLTNIRWRKYLSLL